MSIPKDLANRHTDKVLFTMWLFIGPGKGGGWELLHHKEKLLLEKINFPQKLLKNRIENKGSTSPFPFLSTPRGF